jgi:hypothetical protein
MFLTAEKVRRGHNDWSDYLQLCLLNNTKTKVESSQVIHASYVCVVIL